MALLTARRLLQAIPTLLILSLLLFAWLRALPGGPATAMLGDKATPERIDRLNAVLGLDEPIVVQYQRFLGRVATGELGSSLVSGDPVRDEIGRALPATIELALAALLIAVGLGLPLGYLAARYHGRPLDHLTVAVTLVGVAVPVFFLGYLLKEIFAHRLGWLPPSGRQAVNIDATHVTGFFVLDGVLTGEWDASLDALRHLVLPAMALATIPLAVIVRITRASVVEVLNEDHVRTAKAKGLTPGTIRGRHVLRNALLPVSTTIGLQAGLLLAGAVLTEKVFNWGGLGSLLSQGIERKDYPRLQALIILAALVYLVINLLVDLSYALIDPRMPRPVTVLDRRRQRIDTLAALAGAPGAAPGPGGVGIVEDGTGPGTGPTGQALRRLLHNPVAVTGMVIIAAFALLALVAPWLAPQDPTVTIDALKAQLRADSIPGPQPGFPLGSDELGRDLLSRLMVGARQSLIVGVLATIIGAAVGMIIGGLAGALGGWVDVLLMRMTDVLLAVPSLLLAISIAALAARPSQWTVIIAVAVVCVPVFARLLRGSLLAQQASDHVLAARALGVRRRSIFLRHMLPNSVGPVIVQATLTLATAILDAAALSFLGLGDADPARAEWGLMLGNAQRYLDVRPELAFYPAAAIIVVALGFTLLGESLRDALDPRTR